MNKLFYNFTYDKIKRSNILTVNTYRKNTFLRQDITTSNFHTYTSWRRQIYRSTKLYISDMKLATNSFFRPTNTLTFLS